MATPEVKIQTFDSFLEQYGGLITAFFLHLALFSFLIIYTPSQEIEKKLIPERVDLRLSPALLAPAPKPVVKKVALPSPPVATYIEQPEEVEKTEIDENPKPITDSLSATSPDAIAKELTEEREALEKELAELDSKKESLRSFLDQASQGRRGRAFTFSSVGADQGAIRTLDVTETPADIVQSIFAYYGISVGMKYVNRDSGMTYLNSAQTQDGLYLNKRGIGLFEIFELSRKAIAKMITLEAQEIINRGMDPDKTRVLEVVFGIVKQGDGYDLGIKKFKAEEIR